jgi:hypothetical protein
MSANESPNDPLDPSPGGEGPDHDSDRGPSRDEVFHVLQCRRRRLVLKYVREHGAEPVAVEDLLDWLAAVEPDEEGASGDRSAAGIALRHVHLPKMAQAAAVTHDPDRGVIARTAHTGRFERYLEPHTPAPADEDPA